MLDSSLTESLIAGCCTLLLVFLLFEIVDWIEVFTWPENDENILPTFSFGYAHKNGPHTWKDLYPESAGNNQSPINISTRYAIVVQPSEPLRWSSYNSSPLSMSLSNDGHTVTLRGIWTETSWPQLHGGPLSNKYDVFNILFHWGPCNQEGSEHTLDYIRFPMELQVIHIKHGIKSPKDAIILGARDGIVIVSFFLQVSAMDNPYLDHIVSNLWRIIKPNSKVNIPPFPLEWIFAPFDRDYYTYNGSLSQPPCSEIVTWIIQKEPIVISALQVERFRKICSVDGPLLLNCRPVQPLNERDIYFYEESKS
ncbi:PREDICTED: carbonic anhydrase 1-like [Dinoponera quadriceps]|uniref:Carbonic anhydrase 1-like n=1 Tax=Dinoponera quadriceps TaxID=609295 RepID=A0A6P3WU20_DINQU|nr:PREDICTED: carbonic anhydrase 1-like [Dinoponera quadriceps]